MLYNKLFSVFVICIARRYQIERKGRKFVSPIVPLALKWLSIIEFSDEESKRTKLRAQAIRLSNSGYSINQISEICMTTAQTVSKWIGEWEKHQFDSLIDQPRPGRTPLIPAEKHDEVIDIVKKNPRQLKSAITEIEEVFGEKISVKTLKRIIKKNCVGAGDGNLSKANAMRMISGKRKKRSKF